MFLKLESAFQLETVVLVIFPSCSTPTAVLSCDVGCLSVRERRSKVFKLRLYIPGELRRTTTSTSTKTR